MTTYPNLPQRRPVASLLFAVVSLLLALCFVPVVPAQENPGKKAYDIPADDAERALKTFAHQSGLEVLFVTEATQGVRTLAVKGEYTPREALDQLLAGTPLTATQSGPTGAFKVRREKSVELAEKNVASRASRDRAADLDEKKEDVVKLDTFEVFGRKTLNMDLRRTRDDALPFQVLSSQEIGKSGAANVEDFLKQQLPMNTNFQSQSQTFGSITGNTSTINLRGLGANATLILIDGRRAAGVLFGSSNFQPDLNAIPLAAIDHIDVLPQSASAIYGGAAVGGVVNVVLKRNYHGGQVSYTFDTPLDTHAPRQTLNFSYGKTLFGGKAHLMLSGQYADGRPLLLGDRAQLVEGNIRQILNRSPDFYYSDSRPFWGASTNIASFTTADLVFDSGTPLNSRVTHLAAGSTPGSNLEPSLLANAGSYNFSLADGYGNYGKRTYFGTEPQVKSLLGTLRHELTDKLQAFFEFATTSNYSSQPMNPIVGSGSYIISRLAPNNPFQQNLLVTFPSAFSVQNEYHNAAHRIAGGMLMNLPANWKLELDYTWSSSLFSSKSSSKRSSSVFTSAFASGALNPFVDLGLYPMDLSNYVVPQEWSGRTELHDVSVRSAGQVNIPKFGNIELVVGLGHRDEGNDDSINKTGTVTSTTFFGQSQATDSLYVESTIPFVRHGAGAPGLRRFDLQLAGRTEHYVVRVGTVSSADAVQGLRRKISYYSTNPTIGLKYAPGNALTLRVSYSTGFLPPSATQFLPNPNPVPSFTSIVDPVNGLAYGGFQLITGGNPSLKPQESISRSFGVILSPQGPNLRGLRLGAEYYRITMPNYITSPSPQQIVSNAGFIDRVTRDATTGLVTLIDTSYINATKYETAGWDLSMDYTRTTGLGEWGIRALGTIIVRDQRQYVIGGPSLNYVGFPNDPLGSGVGRAKATATVYWRDKGWSIDWTSAYYGSYKVAGVPGSPFASQFGTAPYAINVRAQGGETVASQIFHSLVLSYTFESKHPRSRSGLVGSSLSGTTIQVGLKNVFNTPPAFDVSSYTYYYSPYGDPRMRSLWVSVKKGF